MNTGQPFYITASTDWPNVERGILPIIFTITDHTARGDALKILSNLAVHSVPALSRAEVIDRQRKSRNALEQVDQINASLLMLEQLIGFQLLMQ